MTVTSKLSTLNRRQLFGGALATTAGLALGGATNPAALAAALQASGGGTLRAGVKVDVGDFYPVRMGGFASWQTAANVYRSLYAMGNGDANQLDPLVESVDIADDFLTWQFKIKSGIQFHDGKELTASDFAYTINQMRDPEVGSPHYFHYQRISSAEAPDPTTLVINLSEPNAVLDLILVPITGAPIREDLGEGMSTTPVGVGPYSFVEHVPQTSTTIRKNPNYYVEGEPLLDEITYVVIPEESSKVAALLAGDVDWIDSVPFQSLEDLRNNPDILLLESPSTWIDYYMLPCDREPFSDQRVRNAMEYAIDRDALALGASLGQYKAWYSQVSEMSPIKLEYTGLTYDLDKAKSLMTEAGLTDGFSMNIVPLIEYPEMVRAAEILKEMWGELNIEVEVLNVDSARRAEMRANNEWDCWYSGTTQGYDPHEKLYAFYRSGEGGYNYQKWSDPRSDELLDLAMTTRDQAKRTEYYNEANQIIINSSSRVATYQRTTVAAMRKSVLDFQIRADSLPLWDRVGIEP